MTMNLGYLVDTAIFASLLVLLVWLQMRARTFPPYALLDDDHRIDQGGQHHGRCCHPFARHRLYRGLNPAPWLHRHPRVAQVSTFLC